MTFLVVFESANQPAAKQAFLLGYVLVFTQATSLFVLASSWEYLALAGSKTLHSWISEKPNASQLKKSVMHHLTGLLGNLIMQTFDALTRSICTK